MAETGVPVIFRVPLIPGINDSVENVRKTALLARELGVRQVDLLPYHRLGLSKYRALGREYTLEGLQPPSEEEVESLQRLVSSYGLVCQVGG